MSARYLQFLFTLDLTAVLPRIQVPTLVLHRRGDRITPLSAARAAAAMIPDARFVLLEGDIAYAWLGDPSYVEKVSEFCREGRAGSEQAPTTGSPFRTVLFTDLADHTAMMQRLGDQKGREVLREHERITREVLARHGGAEVKAMGDGFMASFGSAQSALGCAIGLQQAFAVSGVLAGHEEVRLHIGVNAGEPIEEEDDLFGASVILASRVASKARGGQILVTNVVRELVAGKGFVFADAGEFEMKGFEEPVRLYEVSWSSTDGERISG
jgi:class 3 adenylate cyclase